MTVCRGAERTALVSAWFLLLATASYVVTLWTVDYLPIQDGPAHVWVASAWSWLGEENASVSSFLTKNWTVAPNWTGTVLLWALTRFLVPEVAQAALVTLVVVGFVAAMWFAMGAFDKRGRSLAIFAVPFAAHWYLYRGSFNFALGVALFVATIGFWLRVGSEPSRGHFLVLSGLFLLTYFSHPIPFLAALVVLGMLQASLILAERSMQRSIDYGERVWRPMLATLPPVLLLGGFVITSFRTGDSLSLVFPNPVAWIPPKASLASILESLDASERPWIAILAFFVFASIAWALISKIRSREWQRPDGLLAAALLLTLASYVAPASGLGGTSIPNRIYLCAVLVAIIWLGTIELPDKIRLVVVFGSLIATAGLLLARMEPQRFYDRQIDEIVQTSEFVDRGATILPVVTWEYLESPPFHRVMPPLYAGSWVATRTEGVDLGNLNPGTDYHPLVWRDDLDPVLYDWMARFGPGDITPSQPDGPPPEPGSIDYVLLIGPSKPGSVDPALERWLDDEYQRIYSSQPDGIAHLYRSLEFSG